MGIVIRQSIKGSLMSYLGALIAALTTLFVYPYFLSQEQIGLVRLLVEVSLIFGFLAQLSIPHYITNYYPFYNDNNATRKGFFIIVNIIPIVGFLLFTIFLLIFQHNVLGLFDNKSSLFNEFILYIIPLGFLILYTSVHESYSLALHRLTIPKLNRDVIIKIALILGILAYYYYFKTNLSLVLMLIVAYGLGFVLNFLNIITKVEFKGQASYAVPPGLNFRDAGFFMFNIFLVGFGTIVIARIDVFMISSIIGLAYTGIYSISFFMASIIEIPSKSVTQMSLPFLSVAIKNNDKGKIKELYQENSGNQIIVAGYFLLLLLINLDDLYAIMPNGEIYAAGKFVAVFVALAKFIDVTTGLNSYLLLYSKNHRLAFVMLLVFAVLTIGSNFLLIPILGLTGAALAYLVSYLLYNFFIIVLVKKKMEVIPFRTKDIWPIILLSGCYCLSLVLPKFSNSFMNIFLWSVLISIVYWFVTYRFKFSDKLNDFIGQIMHSGNPIKVLFGK